MSKIPTELSWRGFEATAADEADVHDHISQLERFYDQIMSCRVMVERPHRRHQRGDLYHVRIDLTVPDGELAVTRDPPLHQAHEDLHVAIRDAFGAARRQLQDYARRRRGATKRHPTKPDGVVASLFPEEGYGFIQTRDGEELYFHRNSLVDFAFDDLAVGTPVLIHREMGRDGPKASTVRVHHPRVHHPHAH